MFSLESSPKNSRFTLACTTRWILNAHLVVGLFLWLRQAFVILIMGRQIGFSRECLLFVDVLIDVVTSALGLYGLKRVHENFLLPVLYVKAIKFGYGLLFIAAVETVSNMSSNLLQIRSIERWDATDRSSITEIYRLQELVVTSFLIYPIEMYADVNAVQATIVYNTYFVATTIFQAFAMNVIAKRVLQIKQEKVKRYVKLWIQEKREKKFASTLQIQNLIAGPSSSYGPTRKMILKRAANFGDHEEVVVRPSTMEYDSSEERYQSVKFDNPDDQTDPSISIKFSGVTFTFFYHGKFVVTGTFHGHTATSLSCVLPLIVWFLKCQFEP